jgi:uncharacterized protein DUF3592
MTPIIASMLMHSGGGPLTRNEIVLFSSFVGAVMLVGICRGLLDTWIKRSHGRNWPTISAVIDIVSVAFIADDSIPSPSVPTDSSGYLATLTYVYRSPELQMGDYSRSFAKEDDARAWANSYKGETVKVHVDPRDPTRSVLREEDL